MQDNNEKQIEFQQEPEQKVVEVIIKPEYADFDANKLPPNVVDWTFLEKKQQVLTCIAVKFYKKHANADWSDENKRLEYLKSKGWENKQCVETDSMYVYKINFVYSPYAMYHCAELGKEGVILICC